MNWLAGHAWLLYALASAVLWALVHVVDSYCVHRIYLRPSMGTVMGGLMVLAMLPVLAIGLFGSGWQPLSLEAWILAAGCGATYMATQYIYFWALHESESGIVSAYWNSLSFFLPLASHIVVGERLPAMVYAGIAIVATTSIGFTLLERNRRHRWRVFAWMQCAVLLQVAYFLWQDRLFERAPLYPAFLAIMLAMGLAGCAPLVSRSVLRENWAAIRPALRILVLLEIVNTLAVGCSQLAVAYGRPSLVAAAEATMPAFTFLISSLLYWKTREVGEADAIRRLPAKLLLTGAMAYGVWLLQS